MASTLPFFLCYLSFLCSAVEGMVGVYVRVYGGEEETQRVEVHRHIVPICARAVKLLSPAAIREQRLLPYVGG